MNKLSTFLTLLCVGLLASVPLRAQSDLLKGIFEKEAPEFNAVVVPTTEKGTVRLAVHFTHSKLDELEISFWLKDNGTLMNTEGDKQLVRDLQKLGNRQQDTILITGLKEQHVYTFGADFRKPQAFSGKFSSQDLLMGYRYNYREPQTRTKARVVDAMAKSPAATATPVKPSINCQDPIIEVRVDPSGYCGVENRPAVMVQCVNCQGKQWEFSVEIRAATGQWQPLRYDGKRQPAMGMALRTEPLCTILPGTYDVQVLAWGQNCPNPVVKSLGTKIIIPHPGLEQPQATASQPIVNSPTKPKLPDTCFVEGQAMLNSNTINGTLSLSPYSPCGDLRPYAEVVYFHPGHRNIELNQVPLIPGAAVPFSIPLDSRDVNRGIHTIQVVAYVKESATAEGVPLESFWIRAVKPEELSASVNNDVMGNSAPPPVAEPPAYQNAPQPSEPVSGQVAGFEEEDNMARSPAATTPPPATSSGSDDLYIDPELMQSTINEVQVTASDPNCTPIQDLRVVFDSNQRGKPLFMSWLNPRCCQEEGCNYTIWTGPDPKQLRLLMKGRKSGAIISELLHNADERDQYYEVVVETGNGMRKAAYALGNGPLYGVQEILDYHDMLYPPSMALVEGVVENTVPGEETAARSVEIESAVLLNPTIPEMPITEFETCKYRRDTKVVGDVPAAVGSEITFKYDFNDKRYQYTLYHQPVGQEDWVIAQGTEELQSGSSFTLQVQPYHAGKYVILSYKPSSGSSGWGCLSAPLEEAVVLEVTE